MRVLLITLSIALLALCGCEKDVQSTEGRLQLFYLPPYSPELNPDELVWNYVKKHRIGRKSVKGPNHLRSMVMSCLYALQKRPSIVKNFFKAPEVRYTLA